MWIDARQHIASLVAVFLALGIGMLIGGTVPGAGGLHRHEQALIENLESSLDRFELRNEELQGNLSALRERWDAANRLNEALLAFAYEGTLVGRRINVLAVRGQGLQPIHARTEGLSALYRLLERSGAKIFSVAPGVAEGAEGAEGAESSQSGGADDFDRVVVVRRTGDAEVWERAWDQLSQSRLTSMPLIVAQPKALAALPTHLASRRGQEMLVVDHLDSAAGMLTLLEGLRTGLTGHFGVLSGAIGRYPTLQREAGSS